MKPTELIKIILMAIIILAFKSQVTAQKVQDIGIGDTFFVVRHQMQSTNREAAIPKMTSQERMDIAYPETGLLVYQHDGVAGFYFYDGNAWASLKGSDDLGNHMLSKNIELGSFRLSSDGDDEGISIDDLGNVGIGTNCPTRKLDVNTASYEYGIRHTNGSVDLSSYIEPKRAWYGTTSNHPLSFYTNNSPKPQLTIEPNGYIGAGVTTPLSPLHVAEDQEATTELRIDNIKSGTDVDHTSLALYHGSTKMGFFNHNNHSKVLSMGHINLFGQVAIHSGGIEAMRFKANGNIGIGTSLPTEKLHVNGHLRIEDGTQGANKILVSDAEGVASWRDASAVLPNNDKACYVQLSDTTIQQPLTTDPVPITFSTNNEIQGVTHNVGNSDIEIHSSGVYNIVVKPKVNRNEVVGKVEFHCWFQIDKGAGWTNIPNSNILVDVPDMNQKNVFQVNTIAFFNAHDKIRVMMSVSDASKKVSISPELEMIHEPNIPSVTFSMFKL